jgi:ubiquinone biosynthesis protein
VDGLPPGHPGIDAATARRLAATGADSVFRQIFLDGFFHADPHTGNLLATAGGRLCFLDWGLAGMLTRRMRYMLAGLFDAMTARDPEKVLHALLAGGLRKQRLDRARLETDIAQVLRRHAGLSEKPGEFGSAMTNLLRVFARHGIALARDYTLLAKAVLAIEETGRKLDPAFDLRRHARTFLHKLAAERRNPFLLAKLSWWELSANLAQLREMPGTIARILQKLEDGEVNLSVEHNGIGEFRRTVEVSVNRLVLAVIVAALLIGSSLLARGEADLWRFPPSLGMTGYTLAVCFTLYIIWDILLHGRHKR